MSRYEVRTLTRRVANGPASLVEIVDTRQDDARVLTMHGVAAARSVARHLETCTEPVRCPVCPRAVREARR